MTSILFSNVFLAGRALIASLVCILSAIVIGRHFLKIIQLHFEPIILIVVSATMGTVILSMIATLLVLAHLAYETVLVSSLILSVFLSRRSISTVIKEIVQIADFFRGKTYRQYFFFGFILIAWSYTLLCTVVAPYCTDTLAYHLVIPRDIIRDHTFQYNFFSAHAGLSYGWHLFGIFAYVLGGARGYTSLIAWELLLLEMAWLFRTGKGFVISDAPRLLAYAAQCNADIFAR